MREMDQVVSFRRMDVFALQIDPVARRERNPVSPAAQVVEDVHGGRPIDVGRAGVFPVFAHRPARRKNDDVELLEFAAVFMCLLQRLGADARGRDDFLVGTLPGRGARVARLDAEDRGESEREEEARQGRGSSHGRILHG